VLVPEMVPLPKRSPGLMLHPVTLWCTSCCLTFQYMWRKFDLAIVVVDPSGVIRSTSRLMS